MKKIILFGLFFLTSSGYSQYNKYVPQNPINSMRNVGIDKQKKYDVRKDWIQKRVNNLVGIIDNLITMESFPNENISHHRNFLVEKITEYNTSIGYADFADDYQFSLIQKNYNNLEDYYYKYFNYLISKKDSQIGKIGIVMDKVNGQIQISEIIYGGSIWKSNQLEVGDKIVKVAQGDNSLINVDGMTIDDVRELVIGSKGTIVRLTVQRKDFTYKTISVIRE
jgi:C-terminal processing protease CtpA/Prc